MAVLVAFATSHGSTQEIAERIAIGLRRNGLAADARWVVESIDVATYDAVVLGSAVHGGLWLPEASQFAAQNSDLLRQRPIWLFSVSTLGDEESMFPHAVADKLRTMRKEPGEITELREAVHSREHRNFAGVVTSSDWPVPGRAFFRMMGGRYGDHRNWLAIDAWADRISADLNAPAPLHSAQVPERA